jgi:hypothetical protein
VGCPAAQGQGYQATDPDRESRPFRRGLSPADPHTRDGRKIPLPILGQPGRRWAGAVGGIGRGGVSGRAAAPRRGFEVGGSIVEVEPAGGIEGGIGGCPRASAESGVSA